MRNEAAFAEGKGLSEPQPRIHEPAGGFGGLSADLDIEGREAEKSVQALKGSGGWGAGHHPTRPSMHSVEGLNVGSSLQGTQPDQPGIGQRRSDDGCVNPPEAVRGEPPACANGTTDLGHKAEGPAGFGLDVRGPAQTAVEQDP